MHSLETWQEGWSREYLASVSSYSFYQCLGEQWAWGIISWIMMPPALLTTFEPCTVVILFRLSHSLWNTTLASPQMMLGVRSVRWIESSSNSFAIAVSNSSPKTVTQSVQDCCQMLTAVGKTGLLLCSVHRNLCSDSFHCSTSDFTNRVYKPVKLFTLIHHRAIAKQHQDQEPLEFLGRLILGSLEVCNCDSFSDGKHFTELKNVKVSSSSIFRLYSMPVSSQ